MASFRIRLAAFLTALTAVGICACSDAGPIVSTPAPEQAVGLLAVRERGVLRLLTRNNGFTYFVLRGRQLGFDYELAERFAKHIGVKLEVNVPANWGDLIPMLQRGQGDLIGAGMGVTAERQEQVSFAQPYGMTHIRIVWHEKQKPIDNAEELSGKRVHVRQRSTYFAFLSHLNGLLEATGRRPVNVIIEGESLETERILMDVASGRVPYSLCDFHICRQAQLYAPSLVIGPPVERPQGLAWAVHRDADDLLTELNAFIADQRRLDLDALYRRYYAPPPARAARRKARLDLDEHGRISPFDAKIREAGERYDIDWRLLVSLAFQESRFDPKAETPSHGRGLFGMQEKRIRELGQGDPFAPQQAILAAAAYLSATRGRFAQLPDPEERLLLAVASFQAGTEHIEDARILASRQGLDPTKWDDIAKVLPLLSLREFASQSIHGYVNGAETVAYVTEVWARYRAYRHAMGARD